MYRSLIEVFFSFGFVYRMILIIKHFLRKRRNNH